MRAGSGTLLILILLAGTALAAQGGGPADALLDLLVWGIHMPIDAAAYSEPIRSEVIAYRQRADAYRPSSAAPDGDGVMRMVHAARMGYERRLVAATPDPRAQALAKEYVEALSPCYEWEGMSDCPAREAQFADEYINRHVDSPLVSYLPLLAAHRWLCAAELFDFEKSPDEALSANRRYAVRLAQARRSNNILIHAAAEQLAARHSCFAPR
jgi:hypothetical protein